MPFQNNIIGFDLGYIIGLFEGEGYIAFNYSLRKDKCESEYYTVHIGISNTNKKLVEKVKNILGYGKITKQAKPKKKHKQCYIWRITAQKETLRFLELVFPFLIEKKEKAILVMEFLKLRIACNPNAKANCQRKYTDYERGFYSKYRDLKSFVSTEKRNNFIN